MLSLFYKTSETKITNPSGIRFTIFKPSRRDGMDLQNISIKGKSGQYKIQITCAIPQEPLGSRETLFQLSRENVPIGAKTVAKPFLDAIRLDKGGLPGSDQMAHAGDAFPSAKRRAPLGVSGMCREVAPTQGGDGGTPLGPKGLWGIWPRPSSPPSKLFFFDGKVQRVSDSLLGLARLEQPSSRGDGPSQTAKFFECNIAQATGEVVACHELQVLEQQKIYLGWAFPRQVVPLAVAPTTAGGTPASTVGTSPRGGDIPLGFCDSGMDQGASHNDEAQSTRGGATSQGEGWLNTCFKSIMIGLSQGWSINPEPKGIGFNARTISGLSAPAAAGATSPKAPERAVSGEMGTVAATVGTPTCPPRGPRGPLRPMVAESHVEQMLVWLVGGAARGRIHETHSGALGDQNQAQVFTSGATPTMALNLNLGFSHEVFYHIPQHSVSPNVSSGSQGGGGATPGGPTIPIFGISKHKANQVASDTHRSQRGQKPEPYKGKGIRYDGERFFPKTTEKKKG